MCKNRLTVFIAPILSLLIFFTIFQVWKIDLALPAFCYKLDSMFYLFVIKNIIDNGWFISNQFVGLPHLKESFVMYDFPLQADLFMILIFKFFSYFSDNPFFIANCSFITTFALISWSAFIALRNFNISVFTAVIISILYAFLPYHFTRNIWHIFLSNYMIVPLNIMVGLWIIEDKLKIFGVNSKGQFCLKPNRLFLISALIICFSTINDIYYCYYSCIIFIFSWFIRSLKIGSFFDRKGFATIMLCILCFFILIAIYLPSLTYQISHGANNQVMARHTYQSEFYGLRIIDMILPVGNHYIEYFANLKNLFSILVDSDPERDSASLGIIALSGFIFSLFWLIGKNFKQKNSLITKTINRFSFEKKDCDLISNLSSLNLLSLLFASVGGLVMIIAIPFPTIRSHVRFCIFIAFISLFIIAIIFDKIISKNQYNKKITAQLIILVIGIIGLFDQVGKISPSDIQGKEIKDKYIQDHNFFGLVEKSVPENSMIFILPAFGFPEQAGDDYGSLAAYINSKNLRWSYPAIAGRESSKWQQKIINLDHEEFIAEIKKVGFKGILINKEQYYIKYGWSALIKLKSKLKSSNNGNSFFLENLQFIFFKI